MVRTPLATHKTSPTSVISCTEPHIPVPLFCNGKAPSEAYLL